METSHLVNLAFHIGAGAIGMLLGLGILLLQKGTRRHRRLGWAFAAMALLVSLTATLGLIAFRFLPVFAVLTVLTTYQLLSGCRAARRQHLGPAWPDAALSLVALAATLLILPTLWSSPADVQPFVVASSLGALAVVLSYDLVRWLFPRTWFAQLWRYEHIYKLISSFAALTSAFAGNVLRGAQPWSQIAPSLLGTLLIAYFFVQTWRQHRR